MDELLILARMARRLGVTNEWLRAEADAGRVPCLRAGKRYLFNPEAVQQVLARRAAEGEGRPNWEDQEPQPPPNNP
jgi:excisionase family DNA binding protein